jgi:hypothetical protein
VTGDGTAEVEWTLVPSATSYNVYWVDGDTMDVATAERVRDLERLRYRITGLMNGNTYCYAVSANGNNLESELCTPHVRALAPGMVAQVSAAPGDGVVTIEWTGVNGATDYAVYRATAPGVNKGNGQRFGQLQSPHLDAGLVNGTDYYYVVTAIGAGGEGPESVEVTAKPMSPAPGAPMAPVVTLMEEVTNTLVIEWQPPTAGNPDSYNLYWDTAPGVTTAGNLIADVSSPYVHSGLTGRTAYYYIVTAVENGAESAASIEVSGTPRGGKGGGHTAGFGNNLAFPILFADGYGVLGEALAGAAQPWLEYATGLRPTSTEAVDPFPNFDLATSMVLNGVTYYPQKTVSSWQAQWLQPPAGPPIPVVVDWGDNLQSASLTAQSNIRVETVLYQDTTVSDPTATMTAYNMTLLGGSGITELWGTDGTTYASNRWHVYTITPRLRIQKLMAQGGPVDQSVQGFDSAVYEGFATDEPGAYGAEINVSGKLVYGYVWMLKQWPLTAAEKTGWWRITFSLDPQAQFGSPQVVVPNRVTLAELDPGETLATLDPANNSTSIEVHLQ